MPNNSPFAGLAKVILVLVMIGVLVGLALTRSDLTNFITNSAKAQAITQQIDVQARKDVIDVQNYQSISEVETRAKIDQILADSAAYRESLEQSLHLQAQKAAVEVETAHLIRYLLVGAGALAVLYIEIGIAIFIIQIVRNRLVPAQSIGKQADPWGDSIWREKQIKESRQRERMMRMSFIRLNLKPGEPAFFPDRERITWETLQKQYIEPD